MADSTRAAVPSLRKVWVSDSVASPMITCRRRYLEASPCGSSLVLMIGRFSVDFVSVRQSNGWKHYALEMNLRKGGTTLPYLMLKFLTGGVYDAATGIYTTPTGQARYYHASDNVEKDQYRGLMPDDLIEIVVQNELHFRSHRQQGVVFHLIGALSEFGKLGVVGIGHSPEHATALYHETVAVLDRETGPSEDLSIDLRASEPSVLGAKPRG